MSLYIGYYRCSLSELGSFSGVEGGTNQAKKTSAASYWFPNLSVTPLPLDRQLSDREESSARFLVRQTAGNCAFSHGSHLVFRLLSALWSKNKQSVRAICWEGGSVTFMTVSHSYLIQSVSRENVTNSAAVTLAFSRLQFILHVHMSQTTGSSVYFGRI